ncbi:MAG: transglycosylase domain-containing protein [Myxococcota bacterium]|nr:transglycosylase domain-containing protein [Deltaproteobacteria bacterium]MDQ3336761.1 transglycosylase domain-containing protein [Myxococcota bacterium]
MRRVIVGNRRDRGWYWKMPLLAVIWLTIAIPIVIALIVISTLRGWARDLPDVPDLDAWRASAPGTTLILAADGSHLAELPFQDGKAAGHRTFVELDAMPTHLVQAVLAAEDVRYFQHKGVDYQAIARAAWANYRAERVVGGASTITQQLARNLLPLEIGNERTARRKLREALLARKLEKRWNKREILETYLAFVFLGQNAYGMVAASRAYFDRDVADLDLAEAALLAGLIQAPSRLDPFKHPDVAKARRDEVLARMARAKIIDEPTRIAATARTLDLRRPHPSYGKRVPWYTEQVRALIASALPEDMQRGNLVIETAALPALGTQLQLDAIAQADRWGKSQVAALVWDHRTAYVEALVGGRDWDPDRFDRFRQSCRQPGSAWKPIVYGAALDATAITPGTALRDAPIADYNEATNVHWKPKSGNKFRGIVLVQDAFASSLNAPAIDVLDRVGTPAVIAFAKKLGISTEIADVRPMALGASCVKPIELARAFAVIARRGWAIAPRFAVRVQRGHETLFDAAVPEDPWLDPARRLDRIANAAGKDPDERIDARGGRILDERTAFQLQDMMAAVVQRGTAADARGLGRPAAGKTGTTNDNTDAWFIGFTGRVLGAVWLGFDDPTKKLGAKGDGAHAALPLWMRAIRSAEAVRPDVAVPGPPPAGMERISIDRETGLLSAPGAPGLAVWFRAGTAPTEVSGRPGTSPTDFGRSAREF